MIGILLAVLGGALAGSHARDAAREEAERIARETLAARVGQSEDRMQVERAIPTRWPDASLGCPEKATAYAQVVTPGYRVRLRLGDEAYDVHVGGGRGVVCGAALGSRSELHVVAAARLLELARRQLASRLGVAEGDVTPLVVRPTTWPDAGLGCPEPGRPHEGGETRGFLIELRAKGKTYRYHTDLERARLCDTDDPWGGRRPRPLVDRR